MTDKQSDGVLPALPEPANEDCWSGDCHWPEGFTADQMRDYARTAVAAALAARQPEPVDWPADLSSDQRTQPERFAVIRRDNGEPVIDDDDFKFDALIVVHGDFGEGEKERYVAEVCKRLNAATPTEPSTPTEREAEQAEAPSDIVCPRCGKLVKNVFVRMEDGDELGTAHCGCLYQAAAQTNTSGMGDQTLHGPVEVNTQTVFATQPTASNAGERVHGFDRDELQDVATGLEDGYSGSVNVGADGERLESTNSYAARFIRAALATKPPAGEQKPVGELVGYQLSDGDGPDWHLRLFTKFAADEHVSAGGKVRALYAGPLPQDRQPLGPEDRRRIILGALSIGAAIDMVEATHGIFGAARARGEGEQG